jgi:hypothetical protein
MPTRPYGRRSSAQLERHGPMMASSKLPTQERPTFYTAPGLKAAREAASMTVEEVSALCGYSAGVVASMEAGTAYHSVTISRVSSVIPGHDLSLIREEG